MGELASRQFGRITWAQLRWLGVAGATVLAWVRAGYLRPVIPRVYAVGHRAPTIEADLFTAVLYAGPGAALSHRSAAWWRGLIDEPPPLIAVRTPRRCRSIPGLWIHCRSRHARFLRRAMPIISAEQTVLDLAATGSRTEVRTALARLDYRRELDLPAMHAVCGPARPGSARLKAALALPQYRFARVRSPLESEFLEFCERWGIPLPEVDVFVHGVLVDAYWPAEGVVVELDGEANHGTWSQIKRDRGNELWLRRHGLTPLRYSRDQLRGEPRLVRDDLLATLARRRQSPSPAAPSAARRRSSGATR